MWSSGLSKILGKAKSLISKANMLWMPNTAPLGKSALGDAARRATHSVGRLTLVQYRLLGNY